MTDLVGHFLLFAVIAAVFLMVPLIIGRFVRPKLPTPEKDAIYECGEPTIGTSYVQFDLRFYVVALLFIIFDVEVAFFFPWAMVFGNAVQLANPTTVLTEEARREITAQMLNTPVIHDAATNTYNVSDSDLISPVAGLQLAQMGLCDILVFFGVLLVGFAYVWKRGDLDWVRAVAEKARQAAVFPRPPVKEPDTTSHTIAS